jgi:hypothetical protein
MFRTKHALIVGLFVASLAAPLALAVAEQPAPAPTPPPKTVEARVAELETKVKFLEGKLRVFEATLEQMPRFGVHKLN